METRRRSLPAGWYPADAGGIGAEIGDWDRAEGGPAATGPGACAAVAPHAGWRFSGALAWLAWRAAGDADTVVVIGGHRPAGSGFVLAPEDAYRTPLGDLAADLELHDAIGAELGAGADLEADNTVEVHLPMVKARFPAAKALWVRAPNDSGARLLGEALARLESGLGRRLFVMGSTDLTHYGPAYGWMPAGPGAAGTAWADAADRAIADAFVAMDESAALGLAAGRRAACSVGAAVAAMAYARARGASLGEKLGQASSRALSPGESFVGYAAVVWKPGPSGKAGR